MLKNYIKIAWRNIQKHSFYSMINIIGLSIGISFSLLTGAFIWTELQVNRNLKNADNQYIIQSKWKDPNMGYNLTTLGPLAKQLKERYPNLVANYYRWDGITSNISKDEKVFREGLQICDSTMLNMYGFKLLQGDYKTAFEGPFSVLITDEKAIKYFGKTDVVGQTLTIENFAGSKHDFLITGVLKQPSKNSVTYLNDDNHNQFFISSNNLSYFGRNMDWPNTSIVGYIELQPGITPKDLENPIQVIVKQNAQAGVPENLTAYLVPLKEYYLNGNNGLVKKMISALLLIALFILLMAIINFVNMSVSKSATRMKEIGIRKVLGSLKKQLIIQFLTESTILVFFATLFSLIIYVLTKDLFGNILGKEMPSLTDFPSYFILFPVILIFTVGFIAGIYPAFILSAQNTVSSLKGKLSTIKENVFFRKSLVAFQFGTATIVFIGAIIISKQINLFFSKDLGYNKEYIVSAALPRNWTTEGVRKMENIRNQFAAMPEVANLTLSFEIPDGGNGGSVALYKPGTDSTTAIPSPLLMTDEYYAATYHIPMAAGDFFCNSGVYTDSFKLVINETQARIFGWKNPQDAIGKQLKFRSGGLPFTIAGVTKDFHFGSMQQSIQPLTFLHVGLTKTFRLFTFKLKPGDIGNSIASLQKKWSTLMPGTPFEYTFMDDSLKKLYKSEIQLKKAAYTATALSIIIVLLGVLGLISLSVQKRVKEIGIRKILGASVGNIVSLFIKEFLWIILVSAIISFPLAFILMKKWLNDYVYRIDITAQPFIVSIISLGLVTAVLIVMQTIQTARTNPAKSLRTE